MNFEQILEKAIQDGASDVHISTEHPPMARIHGNMLPVAENVLTVDDCESIIFSMMNDIQKSTYNEYGEVDFAHAYFNVRLRINVYRQNGTPALTARILNDNIPTLSQLGLPEGLAKIADMKRGLVLVTGVTGSGKSTTLASIISIINKKYRSHIITIEDPVEYVYPDGLSVIHHRELGSDTKSFPNALRAALRQDPDVILLGEMRDPETVSTAITAAETGHLVLSTLHTNGVVGSIDRIIDTFPAAQQQQVRLQISELIECVISQQLIPNVNGDGRVAATEILYSTPAVRNYIREGKTFQIPNVILSSRRLGMHLMDDSIFELYQRGVITRENALNYAQDREVMLKRI